MAKNFIDNYNYLENNILDIILIDWFDFKAVKKRQEKVGIHYIISPSST